MLNRFKAIVKDEEGAALVEYGLLLALIAVVCLGAIQTVGGGVSAMFGRIASALG